MSPEAPARSLDTFDYAGWVRHTRSAAPFSPGSEVLVEGPGGDLAERLRVRWVRVSRSSRAALTTIDLQDLADCTSLLGPEAPSSADSSASQVLFPLFGSWPSTDPNAKLVGLYPLRSQDGLGAQAHSAYCGKSSIPDPNFLFPPSMLLSSHFRGWSGQLLLQGPFVILEQGNSELVG